MRVNVIVNNINLRDSNFTNDIKTFENDLTISDHRHTAFNHSFKIINKSSTFKSKNLN